MKLLNPGSKQCISSK
uniref:Uncharacterized protein n=1 Tax=Rhizophora mucronata TaxID=61149 RepID=A0A2P2JSP8_RHIMU